MEPQEVKTLDVVDMMKSIFTSVRLSSTGCDENFILSITKKIKGFNKKMLAWYFLKNIIEDPAFFSDESRLSLFNQEKRLLAKEFGKLPLQEKYESFRLTTMFFLK